MKCTYCNKESTLVADFHKTEGGVVEIRACDNHYPDAMKEQREESRLDESREINRQRCGPWTPSFSPFKY